jgi:hypothetical protein
MNFNSNFSQWKSSDFSLTFAWLPFLQRMMVEKYEQFIEQCEELNEIVTWMLWWMKLSVSTEYHPMSWMRFCSAKGQASEPPQIHQTLLKSPPDTVMWHVEQPSLRCCSTLQEVHLHVLDFMSLALESLINLLLEHFILLQLVYTIDCIVCTIPTAQVMYL